jgi:hypothetical protein
MRVRVSLAGLTKLVLVNAVVALALLCLVEGLSSFVVAGRQTLGSEPLAERAHTEYDEEIGWINRPDVFVKDMYGPGVSLTTNSQRYRNRGNFGQAVPPGKVRIICSGDSFTLGYGVDDDHNWCQLLTRLDPRLETVNLGQGGYGVDQAYLWYKRNEPRLDHDVHIFAFITSDFERMQSETLRGYGRPRLEIRHDDLVQANRPVPKRAYYVPWLTTLSWRLKELRTVQLVSLVVHGFGPKAAPAKVRATGAPAPIATGAPATEAVVARIFAELQRVNQAKRSALILVYLPELNDYMDADRPTEAWRSFVKAEAARGGYRFVDLVEALRSLPPLRVKRLFRGHFTVEGNRYAADVLYRTLRESPGVSGKLR